MRYYRNKTILITGAASGIGRKFAETVADYGVTLILWARDPSPLLNFRKTISTKTEVLVSAVDVTDATAIAAEADQLIKGAFVPDIIINCAGVVTGNSYFCDQQADEIEQTLMVNTVGSMLVVNAFLNQMILRGSGQIVNIASAAGYLGHPRMSVYAASKSAIISWSESLRLELAEQSPAMSVTCVIPGYVDTGMFEGVTAPRLVPLLQTEALVQKMIKKIRKRRFRVEAPLMIRFTPFLKAVLPQRAFDWLAGKVFRVYRSMDTFEGRRPAGSLSEM